MEISSQLLHKDSMNKRSQAVMVLAIVLSSGVVGCRDNATNLNERVRSGVASRDIRAKPRNAAELHAANKYDWIGQAHNAFLDVMRREAIAGKKAPKDLCARAQQFLATHPDARFREGLARYGQRLRLASTNCELGKSKAGAEVSQTALPSRSNAPVPELSATAQSAVDEMKAAVESATDANHLAALLSPIYDATSSMDSVDTAIVQVGVSVTQSSFEYWTNESNMQPFVQQAETEWDACSTYQGSEDLYFRGRRSKLSVPQWSVVADPTSTVRCTEPTSPNGESGDSRELFKPWGEGEESRQ